jgi:acyl-coenzyme A thioesterase PaaI-like protein
MTPDALQSLHGEDAVEARLLESGRSLVVGEVTLRQPGVQVAAHAAGTCALS